MSSSPSEKSGIIEKNRTYYDEIAIEYDDILDRESSNQVVRKKVKEKFTGIIKTGTVIDFGGGTGRDLNWLAANGYKVIFCEPSEEMRNKAIDRYQNSAAAQNITFLNNNEIDFAKWDTEPPFAIKADGLLADFAVFNCIGNIHLLFKNLAQVIKPGGHMMVLMLQLGYQKSGFWKLRKTLRSIISGKPLMINTRFKDQQQTVYVYSSKEVKKASNAYFDINSRENLFEFTLFHLIRK
ncbi:MAG: class SAM-dependent methyltransferase [Mucilaginibacter sp.]|nr:class SAM-dependent methyltransferase [Mucilaginibacter sp.]